MAAPVLRLKRRREDAPVEHLIVESNIGHKRPPMDELARVMAGLAAPGPGSDAAAHSGGSVPATAGVPQVQRVRFRRVASVPETDAWSSGLAEQLRIRATRHSGAARGGADVHDGAPDAAALWRAKVAAQADRRSKVARNSESARRRAAAVHVPSNEAELRRSFRIFDVLSAALPPAPPVAGGAAEAAASATLPAFRLVQRRARLFRAADPDAADRRARFVPLVAPVRGRILNPFEQQADEAVWRAFTTGDLSGVFAALRGGADVNYQRLHSDLTTALMAAAFHGDTRAVIALLRQGALARIADASGRAAARIAEERGHAALAALLRDVQHEEEEEFAAALAPARARLRGAPQPPSPARGAQAAAGDAMHDGGAGAAEFDYDVFVPVQEDEDDDEAGEGAAAAAGAAPTVAAPACEAGGGYVAPPAGGGAASAAAAPARVPGRLLQEQMLHLDDLSLAALWGEADLGGDGDDDGAAWDEGGSESEEDSEDSCREDAPGNEYPEEEDEYAEEGGEDDGEGGAGGGRIYIDSGDEGSDGEGGGGRGAREPRRAARGEGGGGGEAWDDEG